MAVGDQAFGAVLSTIAYRQESTYGTDAVTTTALQCLEPISIGFKTEIETKKLESLGVNRGYNRQVQLNKSVGGTLETYMHAEESSRFLINAMGGNYTFTSLTAAGTHSISAGNLTSTDTLTSFTFAVRKGNAHSYRYTGGVINSLKMSASVGEEVKFSADFVFQDSTIGTADLSGSLSISSVAPLVYVDGTYRYDATEGSLTSSVAEAIQSFELEINNNLLTDEKNRQLGTRIISGRPPALKREVNFKIMQRYDTTTTFNRFIQNTTGAAQLRFVGASISAEYNRELLVTMPNVRMRNTEPALEGQDSVIQSEIEFDVLISGGATTTAREIGMTLQNAQNAKL